MKGERNNIKGIDDSKPTFRGIVYFDKWGNGKVVESEEYTNWKNKHNG